MYHSGQVRFYDDLTPLMVDIDSVQQHPENYNNGDTDAIIESILVNGMYRPIQVQKSTNYVIMGNHTWAACKELGAKSIPVIWMDDDDVAALRKLVADNAIANLARPDTAALLELLDRIYEDSDNTYGTGLDENDVARMREQQERIERETLDNLTGIASGASRIKHTCPECGHEWTTAD
jgi:ParB-like chromosome segregation protein Spo0J